MIFISKRNLLVDNITINSYNPYSFELSFKLYIPGLGDYDLDKTLYPNDKLRPQDIIDIGISEALYEKLFKYFGMTVQEHLYTDWMGESLINIDTLRRR